MGSVIQPSEAFDRCTGYKTGKDELWVFSQGVIGPLSDEQEHMCDVIFLKNTDGGKQFSSREEALETSKASKPSKKELTTEQLKNVFRETKREFQGTEAEQRKIAMELPSFEEE